MWKGVLFFLISSVIILIGLYSVTRVPTAVRSQSEPLPMEMNYDDRVKKENAGIPSYVQIPALYLYANVEEVKKDEADRLEKPKNTDTIAYYKKEDVQLGKKGVIVMAADFDREDGKPGMFYNLAALEKNDKIEVTDLNGKKFTYIVYDKAIYSWDTTDVESLLIKSQNPRMDLIQYPAYTEENRNREESKTIIYAEMK